ncbi:hypothetical protein EDD11_006726 [Mortierella claussenii]|nr:hypothetical protein EDD11_006726 [Mortierella claussenii]
MKRSSIVLILALLGGLIVSNSPADAAPVSRLLSSHPIAHSPSSSSIAAEHILPGSTSSTSKHRRASKKVDHILSRLHDKVVQQHQQQQKQYHHRPSARDLAWHGRSDPSIRRISNFNNDNYDHTHISSSLQGHAVLDEDDDDAGNELLDTEMDGLIRPDDEDTIEGEILEEEEDNVADDDDEEEATLDQVLAQVKFVNPKARSFFTRLSSKDGWIKENGLEDGDFVPEVFEDEEDEVVQTQSDKLMRFGGATAAADLAAGEA